MSAFATADDLALRWRDLSQDEQIRAEVLLGDASAMIRRLWPDVDDRLNALSLTASEVAAVVCGMARRVMQYGAGGVQSQTTQRGPFAETVRFTNPEGGLYLTDDEKAVFGVSEGTASARSVWVC